MKKNLTLCLILLSIFACQKKDAGPAAYDIRDQSLGKYMQTEITYLVMSGSDTMAMEDNATLSILKNQSDADRIEIYEDHERLLYCKNIIPISGGFTCQVPNQISERYGEIEGTKSFSNDSSACDAIYSNGELKLIFELKDTTSVKLLVKLVLKK